MEGSEAEDLLLKAIRSLPQSEQDAVMRSLIGRAFSGPVMAAMTLSSFCPVK